MRILIANHSSFPTALPGPEAIEESVRRQERAGVDLVTDGQPPSSEALSYPAHRISGVRLADSEEPSGIEHAQRLPVVQGRLRRRRPLIVADFRCARRNAQTNVKPVLTGPYTLSRISRLATTAYSGANALGADYAVVFAQEIRDLVAAGAGAVQVNEPLILQHPNEVRLARELLDPLQEAAGDGVELIISTYGGPAGNLYAQLNSLPGSVLGVDLCSDESLAETIAATGAAKVLALGLVDSRSPRLEPSDALARTVERVLRRYVHDTLYLGPACGLDALPLEVACAKLELLCAVRRHVLGEPPTHPEES